MQSDNEKMLQEIVQNTEMGVALQKKRKNVAVKMKKERRLRSCLNTS